MSADKCNLLLIKTCCWHRLQTDSNLKLSCSQFSSPLLSSYFSFSRSSIFGSHIFLLLSQCSSLSFNPLLLYFLSLFSSTQSTSDILCFLFFPNFSPPLSILSLSLQSHHHEEEKRALSREIIVLNNHLMEAKITINKLREDNVST